MNILFKKRKRKWLAGLLTFCLLCLSGCSGAGEESDTGTSDEKTEKAAEAEDPEKKYEVVYLDMSKEEKVGAQEKLTGLMEDCREIYAGAEKGSADDVSLAEDVVHEMVEAAAADGDAVTCASYDYNMRNYESVDEALQKAMQGKSGKAEFYKLTVSGAFQYYGLEAEDGKLAVTYGNAVFQEDMGIEIRQLEKFQVYDWEYTEKGWLIWEKALSKNQEMDMHSFCRILPLPEKCRELGNAYILPVSYFCNNLFLADWNEENMDSIEFNDLYEFLYAMKYGAELDEAAYQGGIPKAEFEDVIQTYFEISTEELEQTAGYDAELGVYPWEPVRSWNRVPQVQPFPEVVECKENGDGTWTLKVDAILVVEGLDCSFSHEVTMKERDGGWIYLGNQVDREHAIEIPGYKPRMEY